MPERHSRWWAALAEFPIVAMAVGMVVLLGRTIAGRITYPYDLEWMEGGMLLHGQRVFEGLPLYVTPSADFIPFIYPPFFPWVLGVLGHIAGLDYTLGRAVSVVGIAAAGVALVVAVRGERGSWGEGIGSAALFFACYPDSGAFFDLVRNDGLLMGLVAWSLVLVRRERLAIGGLLLVAAFATKHTAALYGLPALIWLWRRRGRGAASRFARWSVAPALLLTVALTVMSGGLFLTYILVVPSVHPFVFKRFASIGPSELAMALPWTSGLVLLAGVYALVRRHEQDGYWVGQGVLALILALVMRGHHGGFLNVLIPGFWVLALWAGLAMASLREHPPSLRVAGAGVGVLLLILALVQALGIGHPGMIMKVLVPVVGLLLLVTALTRDSMRRPTPRLPLRVVMAVLVAFQLWDARWNIAKYTPTAADRAAGDAIVAQLAAVDGPVLAPWNPYLPVQAGHAGSVALIALWDIDYKRGPLHEEAQVIADGIAEHRWAAILTSKAKMGRGLRTYYRRAPFTAPQGRAFYPKTGWRVRPQHLWVPKDQGIGR